MTARIPAPHIPDFLRKSVDVELREEVSAELRKSWRSLGPRISHTQRTCEIGWDGYVGEVDVLIGYVFEPARVRWFDEPACDASVEILETSIPLPKEVARAISDDILRECE